MGLDSDSEHSSDSFSGGRAGRELRRELGPDRARPKATVDNQRGSSRERGASRDRLPPPGILLSPHAGPADSRFPRPRSRSNDSREHREVTFAPPPHKWHEMAPFHAASHALPITIHADEVAAAAATDEKKKQASPATQAPATLPEHVPASDTQESKQWRQPEAVRKMFLDRTRAIERYYLNFPVDDAVALTRQAMKTGDSQPLLDFQRAELMALVDAYDRYVLENVFDAFDLDSDGVISEEEGLALLALWLKGAHLHLLPVLHSLVAGLVSTKVRMAVALGRDTDVTTDQGAGGGRSTWGQDDDVAWVLRHFPEPWCANKHAVYVKTQEQGEARASQLLSSVGARLSPLILLHQSPQGLQAMHRAVLQPMHRGQAGVTRRVFVDSFADYLEGYFGLHRILQHLVNATGEE